MHMADALVSPVVGGVMIAASAGTLVYSAKKVKEDLNEKKVPLMGVMGAFVFASQMINFTIPATGSSGHIGGGILLAALLGPYAAFLAISAVLLIQCLFFADGGLLAIGCNMWNMGFYACFIAFPFIYQAIIKKGMNPKRITIASIVAVVVGLQLGAFSVVLETLASGITELPFSTFVVMMQPIHFLIAIVEGIITAAVLCFVYNTNPTLLYGYEGNEEKTKMPAKKVVVILLVLALVIGGIVAWFASSNPDGLEWAMEGVAGTAELEANGSTYDVMGAIQQATAFLPDYSFKNAGDSAAMAGTTVSGLLGAMMTLALAGIAGALITKTKRKSDVKTR